MNTETIKKLEDLVKVEEGKTIVGQKIKRLTGPGENYASLILSVDIIVKTLDGTEEIQAVAKVLPPNPLMQELFNPQIIFRNEITFYKIIVPMLQNFQREQGVHNVIDFFPKYYGSRFSLDPASTKIDSDVVLLLENLKQQNYVNLERTKGFDLEAAKLIITDLAHMHAVPVAFKLKKPEIFEKHIKPHLIHFDLNDEFCSNLKMKFFKLIESMDECKPYMDRIRKITCWEMLPVDSPREPFASICHNDCWVNNTMVQLDGNKVVKTKLIDFQANDYGSPVKDVIFFLFSSTQNYVLEKHFDQLVELYHKIFTGILLELKCDVAPFSLEAFQREINYEGRHSMFAHVVFMLFPIFAPTESVPEVSEIKPEDIGEAEVGDLHKQKLMVVINQFAKRNWI